MSDLLDKAITAARNLPPEVQDAIARMVLSYAGEEQAVYRFTPEEVEEIGDISDKNSGDISTDR